jgi:hypothetical protein
MHSEAKEAFNTFIDVMNWDIGKRIPCITRGMKITIEKADE